MWPKNSVWITLPNQFPLLAIFQRFPGLLFRTGKLRKKTTTDFFSTYRNHKPYKNGFLKSTHRRSLVGHSTRSTGHPCDFFSYSYDLWQHSIVGDCKTRGLSCHCLVHIFCLNFFDTSFHTMPWWSVGFCWRLRSAVTRREECNPSLLTTTRIQLPLFSLTWVKSSSS